MTRSGAPTELGTLSVTTLLRRFAIPAIIAMTASSLYNMIDSAFLGHIPGTGGLAIAGVTIANKVYLLVRNVVLGIGQGMQPVAGYNYGAKDYRRTKQTFWFATAVGTAFCVLAAAVIALFPEQVIRFFRDDSTIVAVGREALLFACAVMPFLAFSTYANQLYQCLGFKAAATFLACCRQGVFFIPLIFFLPRIFGLRGVALTQPGADFLTFLACVPFMVWFFRKVLAEPAQNKPGGGRPSKRI